MKPGWQTTEFWLSIAAVVGAVVLAALGTLTGEQALMVLTGSGGFYAVSRGIAKAGAGEG